MSFAVGLALAASFVLTGSTQAQVSLAMPIAQSPKEFVQSYFADAPIMVSIAKCESRFHQYGEHGSVYRGEINNLDVGVMQINEYYHSDTAKKLGIDLYTIQGNAAYARYLYDRQGTAPWSSSEGCWGKAKNRPTTQAALVALAK